jgi:ATP-dependent DNA helicase DinG
MTMFHELPKAYALGQGAAIDGAPLGARAALKRLAAAPHLLCHQGFLILRMQQLADADRNEAGKAFDQPHLDVSELFAFVFPAQNAVPTPKGLARYLGVAARNDDEALTLVAEEMLRRLENPKQSLLRETAEHATYLARAHWPWAKLVMQALLKANPTMNVGSFVSGLNVWDRIDEWEELAPPPKGSSGGHTR